jgi:ribosome biogenesis GTPase / thiamine phosphate phosphatase
MKEQEHPLSRLGWSAYCAESPAFDIPVGQIPARVIEEQKRYYFADNGTEVLLCRPSGKLRHNAVDRTAMPVVGDFVLVTRQQSQKTATIESILQRRTVLSRKDPGGDVEQILCSNVNLAIITGALDADPNLRRLERFVALCRTGGVTPILLLNKADRLPTPEARAEAVARVTDAIARDSQLLVLAGSARTGEGIAEIEQRLQPGQTTVVLGASGAGKSTLINRWLGSDRQDVGDVRIDDAKGRHTTTSRTLLALPTGALIIDTPGIRELELWTTNDSELDGFDDLARLGLQCRFRDCRHRDEPNCAVQQAKASGEVPAERLLSYHKLDEERRLRAARMLVRKR